MEESKVNIKFISSSALKILTMVLMILDHWAWCALDIHTPAAQIIHIIGRISVPCMCYFIVEGFFYTSNLKKYMIRLFICGLLSAIPFTLFFYDMYGFRQNIMFDYLMGLICIAAIDSKKVKIIFKVLICILMFALSFFIGGWPVVPLVFTIIFYHYKDKFVPQLLLVSATVVGYELFAIIYFFYCEKNGIPDKFQTTWWERLYLLAMIAPVFILKYLYNGKRGGKFFGKYLKVVFYGFYPVHLIILIIVRLIVKDDVTLSNIWSMGY